MKGARSFGAEGDFGMKAVENPVHVQDVHATILHLLRLVLTHKSRDVRLTDGLGRVIHEVLA